MSTTTTTKAVVNGFTFLRRSRSYSGRRFIVTGRRSGCASRTASLRSDAGSDQRADLTSRFIKSVHRHHHVCEELKTTHLPRLRAGEDSDDTQTAYRVAAFQTFLSGRISTFGDTEGASTMTNWCSITRSRNPRAARTRDSRQPRVLALGLLNDGDVGIGVLPQREEALVGGTGLGGIALERVGTREAELGE
jgi:hypothetical protein